MSRFIKSPTATGSHNRKSKLSDASETALA